MAKYTYKPTSCAQALATQEGTKMLARMSQPHLGAWWPIEQEFDFLRLCRKWGHVPHFQLRTFQEWKIINFPDPRLALAYGYAGIKTVDLNKINEYLERLRNYILGINGCHQSVLNNGNNFEIIGRASVDQRLNKLKQYVESIKL